MSLPEEAQALKVAIGDDEPGVRVGLRRLCGALGVQVTAYETGQLFLEALRVGTTPDCVLLDMHMPEMSGLEVQRRMGELTDQVAVLAITADDSPETNLVFSYMNLARAFAEIELGADLYCLHRNRWWQTERGPLLDSGCYVAGLEYAAQTEATVLGKPSPAYFDVACRALDAEPSMTWMVGDDIETDVAGARGVGMRAVLVRTGKFRPDAVETSRIKPDGIVSSIAHLPEWLEEHIA